MKTNKIYQRLKRNYIQNQIRLRNRNKFILTLKTMICLNMFNLILAKSTKELLITRNQIIIHLSKMTKNKMKKI